MNQKIEDSSNDEEKRYRLAWGMFCELRKEINENAKIVYQMTALKITFISATLALIVANLDKAFSSWIFIIPAVAALFFDQLIVGRTLGGLRAGIYLRNNVEPMLRKTSAWPSDNQLWEEHLADIKQRQSYTTFGNFGMTVLFCMLSFLPVFLYGSLVVGVLMAALLFAIAAYSAFVFEAPGDLLGFERYSTTLLEKIGWNNRNAG